MSFDPAAEGWARTEDLGLPEFLRPMLMRREGDRLAFGFHGHEHLNNGRGVIHGGMLATYIDHALGRTVREAAGGVAVATIQLDLHYLAPGLPGRFIEARGEVTRLTRSVVFIRGALTQGGKPILTASGVWKILGPPRA
jgi:uncharacterized protein (TIGR00369 family)